MRPLSAHGRRRAGGVLLHPRQRPRRRGHPRSPRAGRHPHGLVPQRLGRRSARQVRHRAFPRAPDVQGHRDSIPPGEFSKVVAELGGQENAFTSLRLHRLFPARRPRAPRDHDGVRGRPHDRPRLRRAVVAPERDVVLEERRMRVDTDPAAQLGGGVAAALFVHHPYGIPIIGWMHEIEGLEPRGRARLLQALLHARERHPGRRGRRDGRRGAPLAEATYGQIAPRGERPVRIAPAGAGAARPRAA